MTIHLRYEGKYPDAAGQPRCWTLLSHYIDQEGADRYRSSFCLDTLIELGIVPNKAS